LDKTLWRTQGKLWLLAAGVTLVLIVGGLVAYRQAGSSSISAGAGPGLLYFYANW